MSAVFADKLFSFSQRHAEEIAREWWRNVKKNPKTPSYHSLAEKDALPQAVSFYQQLKHFYFSERRYEDVARYFSEYAADRRDQGIPVHEAIYALIMMRRHLWLYAEFQVLFTGALDMYQAIESINRTVLVTDYAAYEIAKKYGELSK